ncbi:MAG: class I SAM-dependent methyltransferase [Desulfobaccales bacterium]|nr:class I SAM-dependent methyltransferase [Desulfobaccales bacterium]
MSDYRDDFYARYHLTLDSPQEPDAGHYERCARELRRRWGHWLPADKSGAILDLGCGQGEFLYFLRSQGYQNISGVDLCEGELARARRLGLPDLICANVFDYLPGQQERFEVIAALNFFEHLRKEEILKALELIYLALKPHGRVLAVTPNGVSPFAGSTRYWDFSHETGFTPSSWRQLARLTGFQGMAFEEYGPLPLSILGAVRCALWQAVRLGLDMVSRLEVGRSRDISRVYTADIKVILTK